jgi:signal transduction histidine kinase
MSKTRPVLNPPDLETVERTPGPTPILTSRQRLDGVFDLVDPRWVDLTGLPAEIWRCSPPRFLEIVHEEDRARVEQHLASASSSNADSVLYFRIRHWESGRVHHIHELRRPVLSGQDKVEAFDLFWFDETAGWQARRRLAASYSKEILARLTTGFAHDLNNVFAGIASLNELCLMEMSPDHPLRQNLVYIRENTRKAIAIVENLSGLLQQKRRERTFVDLNSVAADSLALLRAAVPRRIELAFSPPPIALPVYVEEKELRQAIFSLVLNATEALSARGRITLTAAAHAAFPYGTLPGESSDAGPAICLTVTDTGPGFPSPTGVPPAAWNPSAKPGRYGIGLGLPIADRFARKHGGRLVIPGHPNADNAVQLWLPQANFTEGERKAGERLPARILVNGQNLRFVHETAARLRSAGFAVVASVEDTERLLLSGEEEFALLAVCLDPGSFDVPALIRQVRPGQYGGKIMVLTPESDVGPWLETLSDRADLIIPRSLDVADMRRRIALLLGPPD